MMEMKLNERILFAVHHDAAPCLILDEDRVAVVDDCHRRELVIKSNGLQIRRRRSLDIYGRLALSGLAGGKTRVQIAPMLRAVRARITPVRSPGRMLLRADWNCADGSDEAERRQAGCPNCTANFHLNSSTGSLRERKHATHIRRAIASHSSEKSSISLWSMVFSCVTI